MKENTLSRYTRLDLRTLNHNQLHKSVMMKGLSPLTREESIYLYYLSAIYNDITKEKFNWESLDYWTFVSIMKKLGNKDTIKLFKKRLKLGNNFIDSILY